ncbi:MAG: WecB/TagA/CpsF family glycosyltransferase [Candidatus Omnitrophica bacterium]|nr:WecB/TagA/CpsF family glycosyltransferase [Candidatus Omnitrophota bacterium]
MNKIRHKKRIEFFGAKIDPLTMEETLRRITGIIEKREITQHVVVNVAKLVMMQEDKELRDAVNSCGLINVDGAGILWGAKFSGIDLPERVTGIDLMWNLVGLAADRGYSIYFLGAAERTIRKVVDICRTEYPPLRVAGFRNGYFTEKDETKITGEIKNSNADILFVGIPSPKKEIFLRRNLRRIQVPFTMGVGGSFDVVAGKTKRAPVWMQKSGLEWLYRFLQEPRRMWKRYLVTNSRYLGMLIKGRIRSTKNG